MALSFPSKPEKLIPQIRLLRKFKACSLPQLSSMLGRLPQLFKGHGAISVLEEVIGYGICQRLVPRPQFDGLFEEILGMLPEKELNITDSVYESRLVDEQEDDEPTNEESKQKLPLTLLRIPSDLQSHLFNFLTVSGLAKVQGVCRSLCIAARRPSSLYSLKFNHPNSNFGGHDCYSKPKALLLET